MAKPSTPYRSINAHHTSKLTRLFINGHKEHLQSYRKCINLLLLQLQPVVKSQKPNRYIIQTEIKRLRTGSVLVAPGQILCKAVKASSAAATHRVH